MYTYIYIHIHIYIYIHASHRIHGMVVYWPIHEWPRFMGKYISPIWILWVKGEILSVFCSTNLQEKNATNNLTGGESGTIMLGSMSWGMSLPLGFCRSVETPRLNGASQVKFNTQPLEQRLPHKSQSTLPAKRQGHSCNGNSLSHVFQLNDDVFIVWGVAQSPGFTGSGCKEFSFIFYWREAVLCF